MEKIHVGSLQMLEMEGAKIVKGGNHAIAVFVHENQVHAVDNRCPHMGFPLHMGSLCDGLLTCHWHHARFDLKSGGTLDPWADDVSTYSVEVNNGDVWVNPTPHNKVTVTRLQQRLRNPIHVKCFKIKFKSYKTCSNRCTCSNRTNCSFSRSKRLQ